MKHIMVWDEIPVQTEYTKDLPPVKILLFDDILETHVRRSLGRALEARGHSVLQTPAVWKGHKPPVEAEDIDQINMVLDQVISDQPDVLLNFRAATLTPAMLSRLRAANILTLVWLPDDPVLYKVCYRNIVEHYDIVLNCGGREVLQLYEQKHGIRGVNFPFWTDNTEFPRVRFSTTTRGYDIAFLGNLKGPVRQRRYDMIAALPGDIRIFGKADKDPRGLVQGYLNSEAEVASALAPAQLALNIPQIFTDYRGHEYDFDTLARMGSFEYPSRVIQYAALGLPVFTLGLTKAPLGFPEMQTAASVETAIPLLRALLAEPEQLSALSEATHARFETSFSAEARAILIERLVSDQDVALNATTEFRAELFADPTRTCEPQNVKISSSISVQRNILRQEGAEAKSKHRILFCPASENCSSTTVHIRALRNLGHAVMVRSWRNDTDELLKIAGSFRAGLVLFADTKGAVPDKLVTALKAKGCHVLEVGNQDRPMQAGVDLAWMVDTAETSRPVDIAVLQSDQSTDIMAALQSGFARVEHLAQGDEDARISGLDQALICVIPKGAPKAALDEAIARGTVAVAPDTPEVRARFEPDREVLTYRNTQDLSTKIAHMLADPADRDRMCRRAFQRLSEAHLLEHQWERMLTDLPVDTIAREVRVLVTGYYGHENLGDEMILDSLMDIAAQVRPEVSLAVATAAPDTLARSRGVETVGLGDVPALAQVTRTLDAAILGGGGLWHDYSFQTAGGVQALYDGAARSIGGYARPNLMASACGAESHVYGIGVGPLTDPDAMALVRHVAGQMKSITVRDTASRDLLQTIPDWATPISVAPDMVYAFDLDPWLEQSPSAAPPDWAGGLPVLVVNLRDWALGDVDQLIDRIETALEGLFQSRPYALLGLPMQEKNAMDAKVLQQLFDRFSNRTPCRLVEWRGDSSTALQAMAQADLVLAMRLHTCLLAHRFGTPTVGCSYDPKVTAHFEEIGRADFLFDFKTQPGQLERKLVRAAAEGGQVPEEVRTCIRSLEMASHQAMTELITGLPVARKTRHISSNALRSPRNISSYSSKKNRSAKKGRLHKAISRLIRRLG